MKRRHFIKKEEKERTYLKAYEGYDRRQMRKMTHLERIDGKTVLFDYKTEIRSQETRRFIICQSKGQADILKAAELSIFKITMEGKAKKYEDRKDLTDYMEPVGEKESSYGSDGRKFFVGRRMCLRRPCRDRVLCGLGAAGELAARKIQAEGISVRILFPEETEEEFLRMFVGKSKKGCECIKAKLTSLSAEGTAAVQTPIVYACAGGTKVQDPGMHALEETADKKRETDRSLLKIENCSYADMQVWKVLFAF